MTDRTHDTREIQEAAQEQRLAPARRAIDAFTARYGVTPAAVLRDPALWNALTVQAKGIDRRTLKEALEMAKDETGAARLQKGKGNLWSTSDDPRVGKAALRAFRQSSAKPGGRGHRFDSYYEHDQWWIVDDATGAAWSVVDARGHGSVYVKIGSHDASFGFEQISEGDEVYGTGAPARIPDDLRSWVGRRYSFDDRRLSPAEPKAGQVYLTTADTAEGMQAVLVLSAAKDARSGHAGVGAPSEKTALEHVVIRDGIAYVRFNWSPATNSGNRKGWGKWVAGINRSQRGGYALDGPFMAGGSQEVRAGSVFVQSDPTGSVKNSGKDYSLAIVNPVKAKNGAFYYKTGFIDLKQVDAAFLDAVEEALADAPRVQAATLEAARPAPTPEIPPIAPEPDRSWYEELSPGTPATYARPAVTQPTAPKRTRKPAPAAPTTPIDAWRRATTVYLATLRAKKPDATKRSAALSAFWAATLDLAARFGLDVAGWVMSPELAAEADRWWVEQAYTAGPVGIVDALAAATRSAATRLEAGARRGGIDSHAAFAWLAIVVKLLQASERIPGLSLAIPAPIPAPGPAPARRGRGGAEKARLERGECDVPRPRRGEDALCRGDWNDSIVSCVIRSGGIRRGTPEAAELIHAAGDRRHVPPRLIRRDGERWERIVGILTDQGYIPPDEHGRLDEAAALQRLVDALRGGYAGPLPELNACQLARVEAETIEEAERRELERAIAESTADLPPGVYEVMSYGRDEIPF